jgi:hypothetical protein
VTEKLEPNIQVVDTNDPEAFAEFALDFGMADCMCWECRYRRALDQEIKLFMEIGPEGYIKRSSRMSEDWDD